MKTLLERTALILGGFLTGLLLIEIFLQLYGVYFHSQRPVVRNNQDNTYRILALGESTTDNAGAPDDKSWTIYLEDKLNSSGPQKFAVINKARAGTSTQKILRDLPAQIEELRPHLIIAMMGVNDIKNLSYLHEESFFSRLKVVRIFRTYFPEKLSRKIQSPTYPLHAFGELKKLLEVPQEIGIIPANIENWIRTYPELKWLALRELSHRWFKQTISDKERIYQTETLNKTFQLAKESFLLNPYDELTALILLYSCQDSEDEARDVFKKALVKGFIPGDIVIPWLGKLHYQKDPELEEAFQEIGIETLGENSIEVTRRNYRELISLAGENGIKVAIMGYPATDIRIYQLLLDSDFNFPTSDLRSSIFVPVTKDPVLSKKFADVIFIGNSDFPKTFDRDFYTDLMVISPLGNFGHTTARGHQKIADNAYEALIRQNLQP